MFRLHFPSRLLKNIQLLREESFLSTPFEVDFCCKFEGLESEKRLKISANWMKLRKTMKKTLINGNKQLLKLMLAYNRIGSSRVNLALAFVEKNCNIGIMRVNTRWKIRECLLSEVQSGKLRASKLKLSAMRSHFSWK